MSHYAPQDGRYPNFPSQPYGHPAPVPIHAHVVAQDQSQQPTATESMRVAPGGNTRNMKNLPVGSDGRDWSYSLCGCFNSFGTCFLALCCPSLVYAKNKRRLDHLNEKHRPDPEDGGDCCSATCLGHCFGGACCLQIASRKAVRDRYNISGDGCADCCTVTWCSSCSLTQESREIDLEEDGFHKEGSYYDNHVAPQV